MGVEALIRGRWTEQAPSSKQRLDSSARGEAVGERFSFALGNAGNARSRRSRGPCFVICNSSFEAGI